MTQYQTALRHFLCALICVASIQSATAQINAYSISNAKNSADSAHYSIKLNPQITALKAGQTIAFTLEQGKSVSMTVDKVSTMDNGDIQLLANNQDGSNAVFTFGHQASFGSIAHAGETYAIHSGETQTLTHLSHSSMPQIDLGDDGITMPKTEPRSAARMKRLAEQSQAKTGISQVTLLAVYSNEFAQGFNNAPLTRINQMIGFTNAALARSNILMEIRLLRAEPLAFNNSLSNNVLLDRATNSQGDFANIGTLRNTIGADMVAVISFNSGSSGSGVAWVNGDNARFAYSSTRFSRFGFDAVFAHELGHNFGSQHERSSVNNAFSPCTGNGFTNFACGHGNASAVPSWGTIMSRLPSENANNVYSSPLSLCRGEPCGIPAGQPGAADNVRAFNMSRLLMAEFRDSPNTPEPPDPTPNPTPSPNPNPGDASAVIVPILPLLLDDE